MPIFVNIHDERTSLDATVATNIIDMPDALSHDSNGLSPRRAFARPMNALHRLFVTNESAR